MNPKSDARIEKWDNIKGLLIFLVVIGHSCLISLEQSSGIRILYLYIYIFHIPLFVFTSGLFAKRSVETGRGLKRKVAGYALLGFLLKFAVVEIKLLFGGFRAFHMWSESGVPWYLFTVAAYLLLTWFLRKMPRTTLLILAVIFACFAGYDTGVGDSLILSRLFVFYPFFLLGTMWDTSWTEPSRNAILWKCGAAVLLVALLVLVAVRIRWAYGYVDLFKGNVSYILMKKAIGKKMVYWGGLLRLAHYALAALMSAALVILMPNRWTPLSLVGQRTLQIYFLHRPFQKIMELTGLCAALESASPANWQYLYLLCNIVLVIILSMEFWGRPFRWFWRQLEDL